MATHSSVLAWRIPGTGEPGGPPSMGLHRVGHDWSDLAAAAWHLKFMPQLLLGIVSCPYLGLSFYSSYIVRVILIFQSDHVIFSVQSLSVTSLLTLPTDKNTQSLSINAVVKFLLFGCAARSVGILVSWSQIRPVPPALEAQSLFFFLILIGV